MPRPTVEEQLAAAARRILSDGRRHADAAIVWAIDFLRGHDDETLPRLYRTHREGFSAW